MTNKPEMKGKARPKVDIQRRRVVKGIAASGASRHHFAVDVPIVASGHQGHQDRPDHAGDRSDRRVRRTVEVGC